MDNIEKKLELIEQGESLEENAYELTHKFLNAKKVHVKQQTILKASIVVMRGLAVVASAEVVIASLNLYYDINVNDEVFKCESSPPPVKVPDIEPEI